VVIRWGVFQETFPHLPLEPVQDDLGPLLILLLAGKPGQPPIYISRHGVDRGHGLIQDHE
jgi:hypothetical protein